MLKRLPGLAETRHCAQELERLANLTSEDLPRRSIATDLTGAHPRVEPAVLLTFARIARGAEAADPLTDRTSTNRALPVVKFRAELRTDFQALHFEPRLIFLVR